MKHCLLCPHCFSTAAHWRICLCGWLIRWPSSSSSPSSEWGSAQPRLTVESHWLTGDTCVTLLCKHRPAYVRGKGRFSPPLGPDMASRTKKKSGLQFSNSHQISSLSHFVSCSAIFCTAGHNSSQDSDCKAGEKKATLGTINKERVWSGGSCSCLSNTCKQWTWFPLRLWFWFDCRGIKIEKQISGSRRPQRWLVIWSRSQPTDCAKQDKIQPTEKLIEKTPTEKKSSKVFGIL